MKPHIFEKLTPEVFIIAYRLYAEENRKKSCCEISESEVEVTISNQFIERAIRTVEARRLKTKGWQRSLSIVLSLSGAVIVVWGASTYNSLSNAISKANRDWLNVDERVQELADSSMFVESTLAYADQKMDDREQKLIDQTIKFYNDYTDANLLSRKMTAITKLYQTTKSFMSYEASILNSRTNRHFNPRSNKLKIHFTRGSKARDMMNFQSSLVDLKDRVLAEEILYNKAVYDYKQRSKIFPDDLISHFFGFKEK